MKKINEKIIPVYAWHKDIRMYVKKRNIASTIY